MSQIHILDGQKDIILDFITANSIIDDNHKKSLENTLETYDFITFADKRFSQYLEKRNRIIIPDEDETLREFVIFEAHKYRDTEGHKAQVFANASYLELKKATILYPSSFTGTASQHGGRALNNTGWQIGIVEGSGTRTLTIDNHTNPYEFLKRIAKEFGLELRFRIEHDGSKVIGRFVDLLERVGMWQGREVEFGKDLDGIRRIEKQDIVTALLGIGPEDEEGNRLEVLVEDEEALQRWGRIDEFGNLHHLIEPYEIQSDRSEMTETEARQYTRTALDKRINTQITYECTIVDLENVPDMENKKIRFGDTIKIKDTKFNPPLYLEARVFEQNRSIKFTAKKDIKLGDFIEHTEEEVNAIWKTLQEAIRRKISMADLMDVTYTKDVIDSKDESVYQDGTYYADVVSGTAESNAKDYADSQDQTIKQEANQYTQAQIQAAEQAILADLDSRIGDVNASISSLNATADNLIDRANSTDILLSQYGDKFTSIETEFDDIDGRISASITSIERIDDTVNSHSTTLLAQADLINAKVDSLTYTQDKAGIISSIEANETQLDILATGLELRVTKEEFEGLVNRKNLLPFMEIGGIVWTSGNEFEATDRIRSPFIEVEPGETYVFSINGVRRALYYCEYDKDRKIIDYGTATTKQAGINTRYLRVVDTGLTDTTLKYQLEKGSVATSYVPYISDEKELSNRISTTETTLDVHAGWINAKAEKTEVYTRTQTNNLLGDKVDFNVYSNKMTSLDLSINGLNTTVNNTLATVDGLTGQMSSALSQISSVDQKADSVITSVTEIRADLSGVYNRKNLLPYMEIGGLVWANGNEYDASDRIRGPYIEVEANTTYIMSVNGSALEISWFEYDKDRNWIRTQQAVRTTQTTGSTTRYIRVLRQFSTSANSKYQLEKGSVATSYAPYISNDKVVNDRVSSAEGSITTLAGQVELKASQTSVNSITNRMTQAESSLNVLPGQIDAKVNKNGVIASINVSPETIKLSAGKIEFNGHVFGQGATFTGDVTGAKITSISGNSRVVLDQGRIETFENNRKSFEVNSLGLTAFSPATLAEVGTLRPAQRGSEHGLDIMGWADYLALGKRTTGTQSTAQLMFDWSGDYEIGRLYGGSGTKEQARLHLRATHSSGTATNRVPTLDLNNYTLDGTSRSNVVITTGRDNRLPSSSNFLSGFEVRQYRGDGSGVVDLLLDIGTNAANEKFVAAHVDDFWIGNKLRVVGELFSSGALTADAGVYTDSVDIKPYGGGTHLYMRPWNGGEARFTQTGTTGTYVDTRQKTAYVQTIDFNSSFSGSHLYVRTSAGGEVRFTRVGTTGTYEDIRANSVFYYGSLTQASLEEYKDDIEVWEGSALELVNKSTVHKYLLKNDIERGITKSKFGFVIGNGYSVSDEFMSHDRQGVDIYSVTSINTKAIQELDTKVYSIESRLNEKDLEMQYLKQKVKQQDKEIKQLKELLEVA